MAPAEAFEVLTDQSRGTLKRVTVSITQRLSGGQSLSDALASQPRVFSRSSKARFKWGAIRNPFQNLTRVAHQMEQELAIRRDIQGALLYPTIVVIATFVLGLMLATFVLPELASVFASLNTELPWSTRTLIWAADLFANHGLWPHQRFLSDSWHSGFCFAKNHLPLSPTKSCYRFPLLASSSTTLHVHVSAEALVSCWSPACLCRKRSRFRLAPQITSITTGRSSR